MKKTPLPRPTEGELAILRVLWRRGPSTVREVHEALHSVHETGYTTVLKMMQIMAEKGLATRDDSQRSHVYSPQMPEEETQRQLVTDLIDRAFDGCAKKLVLQALSTQRTAPRELAELKRLLDRMEGGAS